MLLKLWKSVCNVRSVFLFCLWCCAIVSGFFCESAESTSCRIFSESLSAEPSLLALLILRLVPFLLSVYALRCGIPALYYAFLMLLGFSCGYCLKGFYDSFPSGGWLVTALMMFSVFPVMVCSVYLGMFSFDCKDQRKELCLCMMWITVTVFLDYFLITPFIGLLI